MLFNQTEHSSDNGGLAGHVDDLSLFQAHNRLKQFNGPQFGLAKRQSSLGAELALNSRQSFLLEYGVDWVNHFDKKLNDGISLSVL